jgi:hypothetical protein
MDTVWNEATSVNLAAGIVLNQLDKKAGLRRILI